MPTDVSSKEIFKQKALDTVRCFVDYENYGKSRTKALAAFRSKVPDCPQASVAQDTAQGEPSLHLTTAVFVDVVSWCLPIWDKRNLR